MSDRPKAGSFSAYLQAEQKREQSQRPPSKVPAISLLGILAEAKDKELPVTELMAKCGMGFIEYAEALKSLETSGLIALSGAPGAEVARLSSKGEEMAIFVRPA